MTKLWVTILILLLVPLIQAEATELLIDDFVDISDWQGDFYKDGNNLVVKGQAQKLVMQDWSGYKTLQIDFKNPTPVTVTLIDADGEVWQTEVNEKNIKVGFDSFRLISSNSFGDNRLSTGNMQKLIITGDCQLTSIALADSKGFDGPNVYIQTANKYYAGKTWDKIAYEVKSKGFTAVHLTPVELTPETYYKQKEMVAAFHRAGLPVALTIYPGTDFYSYNKYPQWRQSFLEGGGSQWSWRTYNCLREEAYIEYTINYLQEQFQDYGYDALHISEPWLEVWGGPSNPELYACFCHRCKAAFREETGIDPVDLFDAKSPLYYRKNPDYYRKWVDFRVETVANFVEQITKGLKEVKPDVLTFVMFLSDISVEPGKTREYQAMDLEQFANIGDAVIIETAWQDWTRKNLWPGYILLYGKEYAPRVYKQKQDASIYAQPDVGSNWAQMHRSPQWLREFSAYSYRSGFDGYIAYEYSQMGYRLLPSTSIVLDDYEKVESEAYWSSYSTNTDEVLVGGIKNKAYEGDRCLMLHYSGSDSQGEIGAQKDVMLDLSGFKNFEVMVLLDAFEEGQSLNIEYGIVTSNKTYKAVKEVEAKNTWQKILLPFDNFGQQLDLSDVKTIFIGIEKNARMPSSGYMCIDMLTVSGTRKTFLETQDLPTTIKPRASNEISLENLSLGIKNVTKIAKELYNLNLELTIDGGERSFNNVTADILVYDAESKAKLPKLCNSHNIGSIRRNEQKVEDTTLTLPKGSFILKIRLYNQGLDHLNPEKPATLIGDFYVDIY
ncbi:MAG TPA: hypothetical protein GX522_07035 [Firmicutes bacterium]|nr:hypothetical protein [Bacillota bacterium]